MISTFLDTEIRRITEVRNFEGWTTHRNICILVHFSSLRNIFSGTNVRVTLFILKKQHAYGIEFYNLPKDAYISHIGYNLYNNNINEDFTDTRWS